VLDRVVRRGAIGPAAEKLREELIATAIGVNDLGGLAGMMATTADLSGRGRNRPDAGSARMLAAFLDALERKDPDWRRYLVSPAVARTVADPATLQTLLQRMEIFLAAVHRELPEPGRAFGDADSGAKEQLLAYVRLMGRWPEQ